MNYDGLLTQLTHDRLRILEGRTEATAAGVMVEEGAVEEEQAATIQTVRLQDASSAVLKSETSTPQRKISTSSRFINAFQQFYTGASASITSNATPATTIITPPPPPPTTITTTTSIPVAAENSADIATAVTRTPTKGMEAKLLSMWHNVKYGWSGKIKSNFSKEQPVWLLGRCYHRKYTPPSSMETSVELNAASPSSTSVAVAASVTLDSKTVVSNSLTQLPPPNTSSLYPSLSPFMHIDEIVVPQELGMDAVESQATENPWEEGIEGFRRDFYSRIWMTYRREFQTMNGTNYTSDCGWGCMLRSGQMLLAQGLICHFLGRSWRYDSETQLHSTYEDNIHRKIIKWFGDSSSKSSPFSIHALVSLGEQMGKKPGDWYGPASVSFLLKRSLKNAAQENADFDNIVIYVAKDCTIYMQDVESECCIPEATPKQQPLPWQANRRSESQKSEKRHWKSLIILIPLRLGTEKLNAVYAHSLKSLLSTEYCIGIIGGRPKHSLYFVGFQEDKLIHLDPHYCQEMVDVNQENFPLSSFHCKSPRKLKAAKMDPSCCIGFYCQTKADFDNFVESVQLYLHPMRSTSGIIDKNTPSQVPANANVEGGLQFAEMNYPLFTFSRGRCLENERDDMSDSLYKPSNNSTVYVFDDDDDCETEEFVLL